MQKQAGGERGDGAAKRKRVRAGDNGAVHAQERGDFGNGAAGAGRKEGATHREGGAERSDGAAHEFNGEERETALR